MRQLSVQFSSKPFQRFTVSAYFCSITRYDLDAKGTRLVSTLDSKEKYRLFVVDEHNHITGEVFFHPCVSPQLVYESPLGNYPVDPR